MIESAINIDLDNMSFVCLCVSVLSAHTKKVLRTFLCFQQQTTVNISKLQKIQAVLMLQDKKNILKNHDSTPKA